MLTVGIPESLIRSKSLTWRPWCGSRLTIVPFRTVARGPLSDPHPTEKGLVVAFFFLWIRTVLFLRSSPLFYFLDSPIFRHVLYIEYPRLVCVCVRVCVCEGIISEWEIAKWRKSLQVYTVMYDANMDAWMYDVVGAKNLIPSLFTLHKIE